MYCTIEIKNILQLLLGDKYLAQKIIEMKRKLEFDENVEFYSELWETHSSRYYNTLQRNSINHNDTHWAYTYMTITTHNIPLDDKLIFKEKFSNFDYENDVPFYRSYFLGINGNYNVKNDIYHDYTKILYQNRYLMLQEIEIRNVMKFLKRSINLAYVSNELKNFVNTTYEKTYMRLKTLVSYFNEYKGTVHTSEISIYNSNLNNHEIL